MKTTKRIRFVLVLILSFVLTSCGTINKIFFGVEGFKKRQNGRVNLSVNIPREWKHVNAEVLNSYIPSSKENPFAIMFEQEGLKYKVDGYLKDENAYIIFRQAKLKDVFMDKADVKTLTDLMKLSGLEVDNVVLKMVRT